MCAGRSGLGPLTIDRYDLKINVGGEIGAIDESRFNPKRRIAMSRFGMLAVLAAEEALKAAGLDLGSFDPARIGAAIGVAVYGSDAVDESYRAVFLEGKKRVQILTVPQISPLKSSLVDDRFSN